MTSIDSVKLIDILQLDQHLQADETIPLWQRQTRDRKFAAEASGLPAHKQLKLWLISQQNKDVKSTSGMPFFKPEIITTLSIVAASCLGIVCIAGLLVPYAQQPLNVLFFLASFIGVQLLLVLFTLISLFFWWTNSGNANNSLWLQFNPGKHLFAFMAKKTSVVLPWSYLSSSLSWSFVRWGQIVGISFNIAALVTFILILAFSDRSFSWSSTFQVSDQNMHTFAQVIAAPWSWVFPQADIDMQTIVTTRQQALQSVFSTQQVHAMRSWWPFLVGCMVTYGLIPRLILFFLSTVYLKRTLIHTFINYPGAQAVLYRINTPVINTQRHTSETEDKNTQQNIPASSLATLKNISVIDWVNALDNYPEFQPQTKLKAGLNLKEDQSLIKKLNQQTNYELLIALKSWEPPIADLKDFILSLSTCNKLHLFLVPLPNKEIKERELSSWKKFVSELSSAGLASEKHRKIQIDIALDEKTGEKH